MSAINRTAFTLLVSMGKTAAPAIEQREDAKAKISGAYDLGVQAAVVCGSLDSFVATIEKLESDIRHDRDGMAKAFNAPERKGGPSETGEKYRVPSSVSTVKAALKFAFENGVSLVGKDGKPDTFGNIRKANAATRAVKEREAGAKLEGDALARWQIVQGAKALLEKAAKMEGDELKNAAESVMRWVPKAEKAPEAPPAGETLAATAEATPAPARSRRSRKAQGSEQRQAA